MPEDTDREIITVTGLISNWQRWLATHDRKVRAETLRAAAEQISHTRCDVDATCHEADVIRLHAIADAEER